MESAEPLNELIMLEASSPRSTRSSHSAYSPRSTSRPCSPSSAASNSPGSEDISINGPDTIGSECTSSPNPLAVVELAAIGKERSMMVNTTPIAELEERRESLFDSCEAEFALSEAEAEIWRSVWCEFDTDRSGMIARADLHEMMPELTELQLDAAMSRCIIDAADAQPCMSYYDFLRLVHGDEKDGLRLELPVEPDAPAASSHPPEKRTPPQPPTTIPSSTTHNDLSIVHNTVHAAPLQLPKLPPSLTQTKAVPKSETTPTSPSRRRSPKSSSRRSPKSSLIQSTKQSEPLLLNASDATDEEWTDEEWSDSDE